MFIVQYNFVIGFTMAERFKSYTEAKALFDDLCERKTVHTAVIYDMSDTVATVVAEKFL